MVIANMAINQINQCRDFESAFSTPKREAIYRILQFCNVWSNVILPCCLLAFNVAWLLSQPSPEDAILNSLALVFIWDLDEMMVPDSIQDPEWQAERLATRARFQKTKQYGELKLSATKTGQTSPYDDDDRLYIHICEEKSDGVRDGPVQICVYKRLSNVKYETITYEISGEHTDLFLKLARKFKCHGSFQKLIKSYDELAKLKKAEKLRDLFG